MEANSFSLYNSAVPKKPNIAPDRVNDMQNFFDDIVLLANFFGVRIFDSVPVSEEEEHHLFYAVAKERPANGVGYFDKSTGKFVIMKGSRLAFKTVPSFKCKIRSEIIAKFCKVVGEEIILQKDCPMDSQSGASGLVLGRPSNGNDDWKDADGKTLGSFLKDNGAVDKG